VQGDYYPALRLDECSARCSFACESSGEDIPTAGVRGLDDGPLAAVVTDAARASLVVAAVKRVSRGYSGASKCREPAG
jgi:hypothetical protein